MTAGKTHVNKILRDSFENAHIEKRINEICTNQGPGVLQYMLQLGYSKYLRKFNMAYLSFC